MGRNRIVYVDLDPWFSTTIYARNFGGGPWLCRGIASGNCQLSTLDVILGSAGTVGLVKSNVLCTHQIVSGR